MTTSHELVHALALFHGVAEVQDLALAQVVEASGVSEPTMLYLDGETCALITQKVGHNRLVACEPVDGSMRAPTGLAQMRRLLAEREPRRVRVVRDMTASVLSPGRDAWQRYEAHLDSALEGCAMTSICIYDLHRLGDALVGEARECHPFEIDWGLLRPVRPAPDPESAHLRLLLRPPPSPLGCPRVELVDPSLAASRAAVAGFASPVVDPHVVDELVFATNELVANALDHGEAPITLQLWTGDGTAAVAVTDHGRGPGPGVGLEPHDTARGLWLVNHLVDVAHRWQAGRHTVWLSTRPQQGVG